MQPTLALIRSIELITTSGEGTKRKRENSDESGKYETFVDLPAVKCLESTSSIV